MATEWNCIKEGKEGIIINVRVQPKASRAKIKVEKEHLKIWVTEPPVDGKANRAVVELLAKKLGVRKAQVEIKSGETSRNKVVIIKGIELKEAQARLKND